MFFRKDFRFDWGVDKADGMISRRQGVPSVGIAACVADSWGIGDAEWT